MSRNEIAANVTRVYLDGAAPDSWIFATDTVPPRFAIVNVHGDELTVGLPLTQDQAYVEATKEIDVELTPEEQQLFEPANGVGYSADMDEYITVDENYPGGTERMALNLARLVLGA